MNGKIETREMRANDKWHLMTVMQRYEIMQKVKEQKEYKQPAAYQRACIKYMIDNGMVA